MKSWTFEPGHSAASFCARHMMVTHVRGHFNDVTGNLEFDPGHFGDGSVRAEIGTSSVCTGNEPRDEHLRSDDFLAVETYPTMLYEGDVVEPQGCNEFRIPGELTIRGHTKEVPLEMRYLGCHLTPYWEEGENRGPVERIGFRGTAKINRQDFGVSWQSEMPEGGIVVGNTVWITLDIEALPTAFLDR